MTIRLVGTLATVLVALLTLTASATAEGPVHVENADAVSIEGNTINLYVHVSGIGEVAQFGCTNHWEGSISESGRVDLPIVDIDPPGSGDCVWLDDCQGTGWAGQIYEGETNHEFAVDIEYCLNATGTAFVVTCDINDGHMLCDDADVFTEAGSPTIFEWDGEVGFHDPININHG